MTSQDLSKYSISNLLNGLGDNSVPIHQRNISIHDDIANLTMDRFFYNINNLDKLSPNDRLSFVKANIDIISEHVSSASCKYGNALFTVIFLDVYFKVLSGMPITPMRKLAANRLAYIYRTNWNLKRIPMDDIPKITALFKAITRVVNKPYVVALESMNIPSDLANDLCMVRFSSLDDIINAHRVNQIIMKTRDYKLMNEQNIIYIYECLFDQIRYLFMATMLDVVDNYEDIYTDPEDGFYYVFSFVGMAVLTIVNNMPINSICQLLLIYLDKLKELGYPATRFSLRTLSGDFSRIVFAVEKLTGLGHVFP